MSNKITWIRVIYLYLFSLVGLVLIIIPGVRFLDMALKTWIFTEADKYAYYDYTRPAPIKIEGEKAIAEPSKEEQETIHKQQITQQRQRDASNSLAMLIVGLPLYLYHWRMASKRKDEEQL